MCVCLCGKWADGCTAVQTYCNVLMRRIIENGRSDTGPDTCVRFGIVFLSMAIQYGIAIRNVCVRTEPTMEPLRKYKGDVWDRRQESRLTIGEPVLVKRLDRGWMYVSSDATEGYAKAEGVFVCTKRHYERYRTLLKREYQVVLKSGRDKEGQYFRVGTVLPVFGKETEYGSLDEGPVMVRKYLPFTERQMRLQMERMLGIPYSWGDERQDGLDCSSTVRAFYTCFGLALPRNSEAQRACGERLAAAGAADYRNLKGEQREEKEKILRTMGTGTVLLMPGHVMIYAGEQNGESLIFHNCDTYTENGEEHIVRKTVISGFYPKGEGTYLDYLTAAWKPYLER